MSFKELISLKKNKALIKIAAQKNCSILTYLIISA